MIKLQVIGRLGKDGSTNAVAGRNVINFSVAHTERFKDAQGQQKDKTIWVECAYWTDKTAVLPYLKKGTQVYVEGTPDIRAYTTGEGKQGASLTLRVSSVQLLGAKNENGGTDNDMQPQPNDGARNFGGAPATTPQQTGGFSGGSNDLDDLPF